MSKYKELSDKDIIIILEKHKFGDSFSLPDILVQDLMTDDSIVPSFKNVKHFTNNDLYAMIKKKRKKKRKKMKNITKKKRKKGPFSRKSVK